MTFRGHASTAATRSCPSCQGSTPAEVEIALKTGGKLVLASCPRCETRSWTLGGRQVSVADALRAAAGDPEFQIGRTSRPRRN